VSEREPNWPRLYAAVLLFLGFEILIFYLFTRAFA